jgi:heme A synthase
MIQAALIAFAVAGIGVFISDGGTLDEAAFESIFEGDLTFTGVAGMMFHGMNGMMVIPVLALLLLITSFFAKTPGAIKFSLLTLGLVVLQVFLGFMGHETPYGGLLHGFNAMLLFIAAVWTARLHSRASTREAAYEAETETTRI